MVNGSGFEKRLFRRCPLVHCDTTSSVSFIRYIEEFFFAESL